MSFRPVLITVCALLSSPLVSHAGFTVFEAAGATPASITSTRDSFRTGIGGGTVAGANGDFGGVRREINWDGVPSGFSDPNALPANFFNVNSPRGVVLSTPGTGFMVSSDGSGATPVMFGFATDFQTFSPQKLFTAVNSNIVDVSFFLPGTSTVAVTSAFGLIFTDVEVAGSTSLQFFDLNNNLLFSRNALVAGNQGLTFLGGIANNGEQIGRVRITSGSNTIVANGILGNPTTDIVVMDDFLYATPTVAASSVPDFGPGNLFFVVALTGLVAIRRRFVKRA